MMSRGPEIANGCRQRASVKPPARRSRSATSAPRSDDGRGHRAAGVDVAGNAVGANNPGRFARRPACRQARRPRWIRRTRGGTRAHAIVCRDSSQRLEGLTNSAIGTGRCAAGLSVLPRADPRRSMLVALRYLDGQISRLMGSRRRAILIVIQLRIERRHYQAVVRPADRRGRHHRLARGGADKLPWRAERHAGRIPPRLRRRRRSTVLYYMGLHSAATWTVSRGPSLQDQLHGIIPSLTPHHER